MAGAGKFATWDGVQLFYRWTRAGASRAAVVFVHGVLEHSGRYHALGQSLVAKGISFYAFDLRGHGQSEGVRAGVSGFDDYIKDLQVFCRLVGNNGDYGPPFIVSHSMGSLISALYATEAPQPLGGLVLGSTPLELVNPPSRAKLVVSQLLSHIVPRLRVDAGLDPTAMSHNSESIQAALEDPLMLEKITVGLGVQIIAAAQQLTRDASRIAAPLLLLQGQEDSAVSGAGAQRLLTLVGSSDKQLITFPGLGHELFLEVEPQRSQIFDTIAEWIHRHIARE
jgi:alpha-beta hydrolase superfamily lysophospholipase